MIEIATVVLGLALTVSPAPVETQWWEGWEPKNSLPTQATETLDDQAVTLISPQTLSRPQPDPEAGPVEQWRPLVAAYPSWNVDTMLDIMRCESRGVPTAENPYSTATGLFQIMWSIWYADTGPRSDLHDPWLNTQIAHYVWSTQGLNAWVCWS